MAIDLNTNGSYEFERGYVGQCIDGRSAIRSSRTVENAAGIAFGQPAAQGASGGCVPFARVGSTALTFVGIVELNPIHAISTAGVSKLNQYDTASLLEQASVLILAGEDARDGDALIVCIDGSDVVTWGSSSGGPADGSTRILVPNASYEGAAVAGARHKVVLRDSRTIRLTS